MQESLSAKSPAQTLKRVWLSLGDSSALSPLVALLYFPFGLAGPLWIDPNRVGGSMLQWLLAGLAGQLALTVIVVGGQQVIYSRNPDARHPLLNLAVIVAAVSARAIAIAWFAQALGIIDQLEIQYRLGSGLVAQTGALLFFSVLVSTYSFHKGLISRLADQRVTLDQLNRSMKERVDEMQSQIRAEVRSSIDPLIAQLDTSLNELTASTDVVQVQQQIRHIVDDELRPLSHRIIAATDRESEIPALQIPAVSTRVSWPRRTHVRVLINPLVIGLWVVVLAASQALRLYSVPYALSYSVLSGVLVGGLLFALRAVIGNWNPLTWIGVVFTVIATGISVALSYQIQVLSGINVPPQIGFAAFFAVPLMSLMTAFYFVIVNERDAIEVELKKAIDDREVLQSLLKQREYIARQQLGYVIHGSLQTSLNAAAMRLAAISEPDLRVIELVRADIANAVKKIDEPISPYVQLVDTLTDIASVWKDSCEIGWSMDHKTVRILVDSPNAAVSVTEIVREGVGNAIRHGHATEIKIKVIGQTDRVIVSVVDNGLGLPPNSAPGLGSRMLEETCLTWGRKYDVSGTHLVAHVAT